MSQQQAKTPRVTNRTTICLQLTPKSVHMACSIQRSETDSARVVVRINSTPTREIAQSVTEQVKSDPLYFWVKAVEVVHGYKAPSCIVVGTKPGVQ